MSDSTFHQALNDYVKLLQARGQKEVLLSAHARKGLKTLSRAKKPALQIEGKDLAKKSEVTQLLQETEALPLGKKEKFSREEKIEKLAHLAGRAIVCQKCPHLAATRTQVVFGVGNPEAELMFVGEAPGAEEDRQGEPFVGPAGQLLTKMIQAMGLGRDLVYIANIVKCRPDMPRGSVGNRKPTADEMKTCLPYLLTQFEIIQPKAIVALGATALEGLFGPGYKITKARGNFLDFRGVPVMPTFHPSYLLRNQLLTERRKVWEDLLQIMETLKMPISEKQKNYFLTK